MKLSISDYNAKISSKLYQTMYPTPNCVLIGVPGLWTSYIETGHTHHTMTMNDKSYVIYMNYDGTIYCADEDCPIVISGVY